jgi:hypothetical protein
MGFLLQCVLRNGECFCGTLGSSHESRELQTVCADGKSVPRKKSVYLMLMRKQVVFERRVTREMAKVLSCYLVEPKAQNINHVTYNELAASLLDLWWSKHLKIWVGSGS